jgi:phage repressor protein C with HTH and peptisase S24 domain
VLIDEKIDSLQKFTKEKVTQEDIAKVLGITKSAVSNRIARKQELKEFEIIKLDEAFREKIKKQLEKVRDDVIGINERFKANKELINLPVRSDVTASMGHGVEVLDEQQTGTYSFSKKLLKDIGADPNYSDVIFSSGDSMYPTIEGGDCLVVDKSKTDIYDGKIYCVRIQDKLYAKRLQFLPPNKINVISDNPKYKAFEVDLSKELDYDFAVIGEVKWWSRVAK